MHPGMRFPLGLGYHRTSGRGQDAASLGDTEGCPAKCRALSRCGWPSASRSRTRVKGDT